jgi:penicillin-binding protein 1A
MRAIHQGLPRKDFIRPSSGIVDVTVCAKSGRLRTQACNEGEVTLSFLAGTQPSQYCDIHGNASFAESRINSMRSGMLSIGGNDILNTLAMPALPADLFPELFETRTNQNNRNANSRQPGTPSWQTPQSGQRGQGNNLSWSFNDSNPLLDPPIDEPEPLNNFWNSDTDATINEQAAAGEVNSPYEQSVGNEAQNDSDYGLELPAYNPLLD